MSEENGKTPANQSDRTTKNAEPTQHFDERSKKEIERYAKPSAPTGTPSPSKDGPLPGQEPSGPKPIDGDRGPNWPNPDRPWGQGT